MPTAREEWVKIASDKTLAKRLALNMLHNEWEGETMPQVTSANALPDARIFLDRVLKAEKGLRITFKNKKKAESFRFRCYTVRLRELERNKKVYKDPEYGQTHWDTISLYLELNDKDETCTLVARHDDFISGSLDIEEIP